MNIHLNSARYCVTQSIISVIKCTNVYFNTTSSFVSVNSGAWVCDIKEGFK